MAKIKPYKLEQAQALVRDAVKRQEPMHKKWRALEHLFRTGQAEGSLEDSSETARYLTEAGGLTLDSVNLALPHMSIIIASSVDRAPDWIVEPYGGGEESDPSTRSAEELLRYQFKRVDGTSTARDMVQDMVIVGNGFGKVGWDFAEVEVDKTDDELADELAELMEVERREAKLERRDPRDPDELVDAIDAARSEVVQDEPWLEYVSPYDIFVPATARRLDTTRWIAHRLVLPLDEVKANPAFNREARKAVMPSAQEDRPERRGMDEHIDPGGGDSDDPFAEATIFEFYDMRARRLLIFQTDGGKALYDGPLPYGHRYTPFVHMRNFEDGGSRFWAFGDLENMAAPQYELNEYIHEQMSNARRSGNKYVVDQRFWNADLRDLLEDAEGDVVAPIETNDRAIGDIIQNIPREGLSKDVYAAKDDLQHNLIPAVIGLNDFQMGGSGADRMSATAAAVVDGTATLRASDKRRQVEAAIARIGLLLLLLDQEFLDDEVAVRVTEDTGMVRWLNVSAADLVGEYGVNVQTGSTQAVNPATRQQRAVELMSSIIPALAAEGYDTHPLWRRAFRDYGMDPDRLLQKLPPAPPEQQIADELAGLTTSGSQAPAAPSPAPAQAPSGMEPAQRADVDPATAGEVAI